MRSRSGIEMRKSLEVGVTGNTLYKSSILRLFLRERRRKLATRPGDRAPQQVPETREETGRVWKESGGGSVYLLPDRSTIAALLR